MKCRAAPTESATFAELAMDLLRRLRHVSQQEAPATAGGGRERNPKRAWRNSRVVLQGIYDLLVFAEAQAKLEAWQEGGSSFGSAARRS